MSEKLPIINLPTNFVAATNLMIHHYPAKMTRMKPWLNRLDLTIN